MAPSGKGFDDQMSEKFHREGILITKALAKKYGKAPGGRISMRATQPRKSSAASRRMKEEEEKKKKNERRRKKEE